MRFVEVTRESHERLAQEYWRFWYDERLHALVLDEYASRQRPTLRHKFRTVAGYARLGRRKDEDVVGYVSPDIPEDVAQEAHDQFSKTLRVVRDREEVR